MTTVPTLGAMRTVPAAVRLPAPGAAATRTALADGRTGRLHTYAELSAAIRGCAAGLLELGVLPGDVVALAAPNGALFIAAYHGVLLAGGVVQLLDPLAPAAEHDSARLASGARWLIAESPAGVLVTTRPVPGTEPAWIPLPTDAEPQPWPDVDAATTAVLAASSGTGGRSKYVRLTHHNLAANLEQIHSRHHLGADDTVLAVTPFRHIYGMQMAMNHTLQVGGSLVTAGTPLGPARILSLAQDHRVTIAYLVPSVIAELGAHHALESYDLSALRMVFSGGAPLPRSAAQTLSARLGVPVLQGYGMTEAGCSHLIPDGESAPADSVGKLLPGTEAVIVGAGATDRPGAEGELWIRGPQLTPGYLDGPAGTAAVTGDDGWLRTGDLARVDEHGWYTITGRLKDLIKYKGHQVAPADLEALLLTHPAVTDAAVIGIPDPACGQLPKAFVVLRRPYPLQNLLAHVAEQVSPQRRIRLIEPVDELPRTSTGKILRHQLNTTRPLLGTVVMLASTNSGLGRALAGALASAGAHLVLAGRAECALAAVAADAGARGVRATTVLADLSESGAINSAVAQAMATYGRVDVLITSAGIPDPLGPLLQRDDEVWRHSFKIDLHKTFRAFRAVVPLVSE